MSELTTDPNDPRLTHGPDDPDAGLVPQAPVYLILSEEERAKGFVRPVRRTYVHGTCGEHTRMSQPIAETYARNPGFYGATYCVGCCAHYPVGEFFWLDDGLTVGS